MLLHRYFGSHAFETLKEAKLKTARLSSFNDPFEFMYVYKSSMTYEQAKNYILSKGNDAQFLAWVKKHLPMVSEAGIQKHLKNFKSEMICEMAANFGKNCELSYERRREIIDIELRALCFSDSTKVTMLDEILLWSHYARKHEGIRIGFEFPNDSEGFFEISEILYQEKRVEVDFSFGAEFENVERALKESATTKSLSWKYEHEVRLFTKTESCEPKEIKIGAATILEHFLAFNPAWVKYVDFGALCSDNEIQKVMDLLKSNYAHAISRKAYFHKTDYALEYRRI